jgi:non-specific serine/threonine protein kinase
LLIHGQPQAAADMARACLDLANRFSAPFYVSDALQTLGLARLYLGDPNARSLLEQGVGAAAVLGPTHPAMAYAKFALSTALLLHGDPAAADQLLADTQAICRAHGDTWALGIALSAAVHPALRLGHLTQAAAYGRDSLRARRALRDTHGAVASVELLAWVAAAGHDHPSAARLLGAADRHWAAVGGTPFGAGPWLRDHEEYAARTRQALGGPGFDAEFARGRELTLDQAVAYALGEDQALVDQPPSRRQDARLTRREGEIAELVAQGMSNRQIAGRLAISQRTVESHVESVLTKFGFTSRAQIAAWLAMPPNSTRSPS